jgi:hypothetical protein
MPAQKANQWAVVCLAAAAVAFGGMWWQERALVAAYRDESVCWRVVREEGPPFRDVSVLVSSHPKAAVTGTVATAADRERLRNRLSEELGAERWPRVAFNVRVATPGAEGE